MTVRHFCTHFDINYTPHARVLAESLYSVSPSSKLIAFCLDDESYSDLLGNLPINVKLYHYSVLEKVYPEMLTAKNNRSKIEYFYTCSPIICDYALNYLEDVLEVTYLDADLYFFSSPEPIFNELDGASVGIIEHRFNFFTRRNKVYGIYNVGWITFRKDAHGIACVKSWKDNCIDWCYQRLEDGKYADQKYLDYWQQQFDGVRVINHLGANVAIWNIGNYRLSLKNNKIFVNKHQLIFYHFANLKQIDSRTFQTDLSRVLVACRGILMENIYKPYALALSRNLSKTRLIRAKEDVETSGLFNLLRLFSRSIRSMLFPDKIKI